MPIQVIGAFLVGVFVGCNRNKILTKPIYPYGYPFYTKKNNKQTQTKETTK